MLVDFLVPRFVLDNCLRMIRKKKCLFFVEFHQDVVLEDHLVVGEKCLSYNNRKMGDAHKKLR